MLSAIGTTNSFKGNSHVKTSPFRSLAAASALMVGGTGLAACSQESPTGPSPKPAATLSQEALATAQETSTNTYNIYKNLGVPIEVTSSTSGPVAAARALATADDSNLYFNKATSSYAGQTITDSALGIQSDGGTKILTRTIDDIGDTTFSMTTRYPISGGTKEVTSDGWSYEKVLGSDGVVKETIKDANGNIANQGIRNVYDSGVLYRYDSTGALIDKTFKLKTYFSKQLKTLSSVFTKPSSNALAATIGNKNVVRYI